MFSSILTFFTGGLSGLSTYAIVGILTMAVGAYGSYKITADYYQAQNSKILVANQKKFEAQVEKDNAAAQVALNRENQLDELNTNLWKQLSDVVSAPVYANACMDTNGLHIVNRALAGSATATTTTN